MLLRSTRDSRSDAILEDPCMRDWRMRILGGRHMGIQGRQPSGCCCEGETLVSESDVITKTSLELANALAMNEYAIGDIRD